eukprot:540385_1
MLADKADDNKNDEKEEKKEAKDNSFQMCGLHQFFNLKQLTPNIYDLRASEEYKKSHVNGAANMSEPKKLDKFDEILPYPVVIYGDKNNTSKDIIDHIWKLIQSIDGKNVSLYVFDGEYKDIYTNYGYLCGNKIMTYPNMILFNELFLGDGMMAENKDIMNDLGITHIVNVTKMDFMLDNEVKKRIKYLKLSIDDTTMDADKMSTYFDSAAKFMDDALINNNKDGKNKVFVHCMAGVSRSASIVISYLMKSRKYTLCDAYIHTKKCRQRIGPNAGFRTRLIEYEKKLYGKSTEKELDEALKTKAYAL